MTVKQNTTIQISTNTNEFFQIDLLNRNESNIWVKYLNT